MPRILLAALALSLAACGGAEPQANVTGLRLRQEGQNYPTLTGTLVNRGLVPIQSADVSVTLYDGDNRPIEDILFQVGGVAPGDSARFEKRLDLPANGARLKYVGLN